MPTRPPIPRRDVLKSLLLSGTACLAGNSFLPTLASAQSNPKPPNIILIMTDDQGQWALGCYGNREIKTPTIDQLAADGVRFSHAYANTPVCSPSRATFMTGLIPSQHGIHDWIKNENVGPRARCLVSRFPLFTDVFSAHGYTCGLSGKWHLGDSLNAHKSFSYWFTIPQGSSQYNDADVIWNGKIEKSPGYLTDRITDHAIDFIEKNQDQPFFLDVQYTAPHGPWEGHPEEFLKLYENCPFDSIPRVPTHPWASANINNNIGNPQKLAQYFASISAVDAGVARILETLDKTGLRGNTIVIFASDQGFQCGHNGLWGKGNASNPRNMFEESMLIPLIYSGPNLPQRGLVLDQFVSAYDFMPTILELAGLNMPTAFRYPGRSYAPLLQGREAAWEDLVYGEYGRTRMVRTSEWKYVHRSDGGPHELYNLVLDPREDRNVAQDPFHNEHRLRLRKMIDDWFAEYAEGDANPVGQEYHRPE
ncbi:MAG: sulfatase-like hydrolase/transferase [bacterium]